MNLLLFSDRDVKEDVVNGDSKGIELKAITYKDPEKGDLEKGADINLFEKADFEKAIELTGKYKCKYHRVCFLAPRITTCLGYTPTT
uniref:Uncharacterized protein n=1 Tax=Timema poppense TaxID=170557 RepID=A0A7R9DSM8_TIMPO|nr:unnamed protein product [Timema poppensis]